MSLTGKNRRKQDENSISSPDCGLWLDLLLGDPSFLYHPIRVIGNLIALLEKWLRKVFPKTPKGELAGGVFLVILVCLAGYGVPALLLFAAFKIHPVIGFLLEVLWCWQIPATKCLKDESMKVYQKLKENDLPGAQLCGFHDRRT